MRLPARFLLVLLVVGLVALPSAAEGHLQKAHAKGSVTGPWNDVDLVMPVVITITNEARRKRQIACDFLVKRRSDNAIVSSGNVGASVRGGKSRSVTTTAYAIADPGAPNTLKITVPHCHDD